MLTSRILAIIVLLISIFTLPFWVSFILAILGIIYFNYFFEAVIIFLISDFFYGAEKTTLYNITFVSFLLILVLLLITEFIKKRLRLNDFQ